MRLRLFLRSFLLQAGYGDERRQALGFAWAVDPALRRAHRGAQALRDARKRQLACVNTQPVAAGLVLGTTAALEARGQLGREAALKQALCCSLAAAGDSFFWGALRPLAAATAWLVGLLAVRLEPAAWLAGPAAGLLAFNGPALAIRWRGLSVGLEKGEAAALEAAALEARAWTRRVRRGAAPLLAACCALALADTPKPAAWLLAGAFAAGALLSARAGGALRLTAAAGVAGALASAAGWIP